MPLNIELLKQVKEQILSHPEKFRMNRQLDCGCIADFVVFGVPPSKPGYWQQVKEKAEEELYPDYDYEELSEAVQSLFYVDSWDKDLQVKRLEAVGDQDFQKTEAQLASQMIDRLIAKYPPVEI